MEATHPRLTDFTQYRVTGCAAVMAAIDRLVAQRPDPESDAFLDLVCEAMALYHAAGRLDVDEQGESIADALRLGYELDGLGAGLRDAALRKLLVERVAEGATSYVECAT